MVHFPMNRIGIMKKKYLICIYEERKTIIGIGLAILSRWVPQYDLGTHSVVRDYYQTVYHICRITNLLLSSCTQWNERQGKAGTSGGEPYKSDKIEKQITLKDNKYVRHFTNRLVESAICFNGMLSLAVCSIDTWFSGNHGYDGNTLCH
jgi:predicted glycosyl hydrolase (DUF1957 family)